jgi:hypothetical protein
MTVSAIVSGSALFAAGWVAALAWRWKHIPDDQDIHVSEDADGDLRIRQGDDQVIVPGCQAAHFVEGLWRFIRAERSAENER